jgi:Uncharacterized protein conserved in bacteria (DUF2252)
MSPVDRLSAMATGIPGQVLTISLMLIWATPARAQLRPEPGTLELAPRELIDQMQADPIQYFRFVNRPWIARVCEVFAEDIRDLLTVRLHGDAHLEQFAVTRDEWGLDDFDDSARGPALVDIVRFLGSIDLVARQRGWIRSRNSLFDRFFDGYRRGLAEPDYRAPQPDIVRRLRARAPGSREAFLAWGETLMRPMVEESMTGIIAAMDALSRVVYAERPDLPAGYLTVIRAGWLRMGVGSAVGEKILIRIQGPSAAPEDDELVEAKELRDLGGLRCLEGPPPGEPALRVILGVRQLGRLKHNILAAGPDLVIPELVIRQRQLRDWWIRSWDPSYRELKLDDLRSVQDLAAIAYDAGAQLGAGCLKDVDGSPGASQRKRELTSLARLERRIREETPRLVDQLLLGWKELGHGSGCVAC